MIYTVVGDPHAKPDNLDKISKLFDLCEELGNPAILLGDTFDTKEILRGKCLNLVYSRLKNSKLKWIILVGNHDLFNLHGFEHSLEVLKELPNVTVIDKLRTIGEANLWFTPYIHDVTELKAELANVPNEAIVFGHFAVRSFDYGNGFISEDELTLEDLARFKLVISGHFHKFQERENLVYLGTPFSHSFGESNQDKFIAEFDSDTCELQLIPTPFPKHTTITLNCDDPGIDKFTVVDSSHTRLILEGRPENLIKFDKSEFPGVKFIEHPRETNVSKGPVISENDSNEVKFQRWATEIGKLSPEALSVGLEILRAAT